MQPGALTIPQVVNANRNIVVALVHSFASLTAGNELQTTAKQARHEAIAIDYDLLLEATLRAMDAGMNADNDAIR